MGAKKRSSVAGRTAAARASQSPPIVRTMVVDALQSWVVPSAAGLVAAVSWLLSRGGFGDQGAAVIGLAAGLLVLVLFSSLRPHFFAEPAEERATSIAL